ncbi:MAG: UvrD-helicase domain-containing protein [Myxococcales bacterium]|nr:UvrD-helicase domain-containing protein [Myxococcales bacterium]
MTFDFSEGGSSRAADAASLAAIVEGLNPAQREAVECTEGPLLVLAGAGSGKTRVLTSRIAHLIGGCGIPPDSILAVTFTNKAAGEMRERVEKMLGPVGDGLWLGTFHSVCVRILRRDIGHLGRSRGFVIYDESDSLGVVKEVLRRHRLDPKTHEPRRLRWRIDQWKNQGVLPARAVELANDIDDELSAELYVTYQRLLAEANALDFNDLLLLTVELFERNPEVLAHYQRRWQYVLVDEYQDTNRVQYQLVRLLADAHRNLCVVGDPDQSIYAWRGADIRNILDFERDYEDARVVKLEQNYRSTQPILTGASAVVQHNTGRRQKRMFTEREGGEAIRVFEAVDDREESQFVVRQVLDATRRGARKHGDFAVLYRTNAQSRAIEEELLKYDVPYAVVGGVRFYDRAEIKDVLAYLRLLVNPRDDQALRRIVNRPVRGIGKTTVERAEEVAAREGIGLLDALGRLVETGAAGTSAARVVAFLDLVAGLAREIEGARIDDALARVMERSGYLAALEKDGSPEAEGRLDNLKELLASAEDFHAANVLSPDDERGELELFLDQVALISDLDGYEQREERVSLMTVHSAKGLEYPCVLIVGMEEGIFPHASSSQSAEGIEEERRLFYVAMTRAMEHLWICHAGERRRYGGRSYQRPSRFLEELPEELVERIASRPTPRTRDARGWDGRGRRDGAGASGASGTTGDWDEPSFDYSFSQEGAEEASIRKGTRVRHPTFGLGTIVAVVGNGLEQKLRIKFDRVGVKTVMVRYANLELA